MLISESNYVAVGNAESVSD